MRLCVAEAAAVTLFAAWLILVDARFVVEKSSITVLSPHKMRTKRDGAIGNFGLPDYGGFIVGSVVYPAKGSHGCKVFDGDKPFKLQSYRPTIVLLDRGGIYLYIYQSICVSICFFGFVFVDFDSFIVRASCFIHAVLIYCYMIYLFFLSGVF